MPKANPIFRCAGACGIAVLALSVSSTGNAKSWHYQIVRNLYPAGVSTPLTLSPDGTFLAGGMTGARRGSLRGVQIGLAGKKISIKLDFPATDTPQSQFLLSQTGYVFGVAARTGDDAGATVFQILPDGAYRTLYAAGDGVPGRIQFAPLSTDSAGNLYGTDQSAGTNHAGTVFKVTPAGSVTILHEFGSGQDGAFPESGVIADRHGNLYGTTQQGGANNYGTVFKIAPNGKETILHAFQGYADGAVPIAGLVRDKDGNLYGATSAFGMGGGGTVFKLAPDGTETILHALDAENDGYLILAPLVRDREGNLYGTAPRGGQGSPQQVGTVFEVSADGNFTVLHAFGGSNGGDGDQPNTGVTFGADGNLYGTTLGGGTIQEGGGIVYELSRGH